MSQKILGSSVYPELRLFAGIFLSFILMTIVGTLFHEFGHYSVARGLGYKATISYAGTNWNNPAAENLLKEVFSKYRDKMENDGQFAGKETFTSAHRPIVCHAVWTSLGGPLQTMITGSVAFAILFLYRKKFVPGNRLTLSGWLAVFIALLWLRQVANLAMSLFYFSGNGEVSYRTDEIVLAVLFGLHPWSIQFATGAIGVSVLAVIVFVILPKRIVLTFLVAGLLGGIVGYYLWFVKLGTVLLP